MKHFGVLFITGVLAFAGTATAASTLYAATKEGPFKSTDGGVTWKLLTVTSNDPSLPGEPSIPVMAVDPQTPSTVYAFARFTSLSGQPLAFLKSTDSGTTWSVVSKPTFTYTFAGGALLAIDPVKTNVLFTMNASNGLELSTDGGITWSAPTIAKPAGTSSGGTSNQPAMQGLAVDPNHSGVVYAIGGNSAFHPGKGYLFKSTDFGNTWTLLTSAAGFGSRLFINPKNSLEMYGTSLSNIGCTDPNGGLCGIYKTTDGGQSWTELNIPESLVQNIAFDVTPGLLYAGAYDGLEDANVYSSVDGGVTWKPGFKDSTALVPNFGMDVVRADPNAANTAYTRGPTDVTTISKTTNGGATWTQFDVLIPYQCGSQTCTKPTTIFDLVVAPQPPGAQPSPAVTSVVNAAGFQPGVAANSWVTIQGTNLAPQTDDWSHSIVNGALPTSLDGVSVTIGGKPAYVYYISPGQLNVLAPDIAAGSTTVTVSTPGGTSTSFASTASVYGPAFFLWPDNQVVATRQDYSYAVKAGTFAGATTVAAKPGDVIILWGTGFGPTFPAAPVGVSVPGSGGYSTAAAPTVTIGNTPATVYGAALAPGSAGLYQIAIQVPSTLADGNWPIQATIGGVTSPTGVVLSVAH
ncbi:MAG TPA: IPT/TIG domain-containing protein [Candidatus Limnocylindrales bacterium]|nr:IPT/TIG domain-containing protein [Candidatus Limnocylindrales bacterium]